MMMTAAAAGRGLESNLMRKILIAAVIGAATMATPSAWAVEPVGTVAAIEMHDADDRAITIPAGDRTTVLAFVRGGQPQSQLVLRQVEAVVGEGRDVQVIVLLSGPDAREQVEALRRSVTRWPIVLDPAFSVSGQLNVHAWPTTVVIGRDARELAHLAGTPKSLRADLAAHLDFGEGKIDAAQLAGRLANREVVSDSNGEAAARRHEVARRLMRSGKLEAAREQLDGALQLKPDDPTLRLALARLLLLQRQPAEAVAVLDAIPEGNLPPGQMLTLRGAAAIGMEQWEQARAALIEALKLNPSPAEAYYLLGLVYEHEQDFPQAATAFRRALESGAEGDLLISATRPAAAGE